MDYNKLYELFKLYCSKTKIVNPSLVLRPDGSGYLAFNAETDWICGWETLEQGIQDIQELIEMLK